MTAQAVVTPFMTARDNHSSKLHRQMLFNRYEELDQKMHQLSDIMFKMTVFKTSSPFKKP